jgi:hypothetical protein
MAEPERDVDASLQHMLAHLSASIATIDKRTDAIEHLLTPHEIEPIADFSEWAKLPLWSDEEFAALPTGRNPDALNSATVATFKDRALAADYQRNLRLIRRAQLANELAEYIAPADAVAWAPGILDLPTELIAAVNAAPARPRRRSGTDKDIEIHHREANILLVIGLLVIETGYTPPPGRSPATTRILNRMATVGIPAPNETTIRRILGVAHAHLKKLGVVP